ncbi:hypothetical protein FGO68_gene8593 [Halteria grandinella]|uniref:Bax inhibitor-1/YccA family protein n=1 Tax=Halteria grandinella TaxID=5974 RepID=A0A8J8NLW4_HALGN|nr:hypothetical protein FGO68_gene8593 [Halteria grandinella]
MHFFHPEVQRRIRQCMMYFGSGLGLTGIMVGAMRNSTLPFTVNPWLFLIGSIALLIGTQVTDIQFNPIIKHGLWLGFMGSMAFTLVPLISMASMPIIYDALFATGFTMAGLGLVAYNSPSEQFLQWGGALGMALAGMLGIGIASLIWPNSPGLFSIWLYGGLLLFGAFVLFDTQKVIFNAKLKSQWDPINESLAIYMDAIILFQRFLIIFMGRSQNKK